MMKDIGLKGRYGRLTVTTQRGWQTTPEKKKEGKNREKTFCVPELNAREKGTQERRGKRDDGRTRCDKENRALEQQRGGIQRVAKGTPTNSHPEKRRSKKTWKASGGPGLRTKREKEGLWQGRYATVEVCQ